MTARDSTEQRAAALWPEPPELPRPAIMDQHWTDAVFLHWRVDNSVAARFMPPGVRPDDFDGSSWVGLIGFRMQRAGLGRGPARFGMHTRFGRRTLYVPNTHEPWPLRLAELHDLDDGLVAAAGIGVDGPPESVLYSPGVRTRFGRPRVVAE